MLFVGFFYLSYMFLVGGTKKQEIPHSVDKVGDGFRAATHLPMFSERDIVDAYIFVSDVIDSSPEDSERIAYFKSVVLTTTGSDDWNPRGNPFNYTWKAPDTTLNNGSAYLHFYIAKEGVDIESEKEFVIHKVYNLTNKRLQPKVEVRYNLISGENDLTDEEIERLRSIEGKMVSYWCADLSIEIVMDFTKYGLGKLPPDIQNLIVVRNDNLYENMVYFNDVWRKESDCTLLNKTIIGDTLNLTLSFGAISSWKFRIMNQFATSMKSDQSGVSQMTASEVDEMKRIILETNPVLLTVTAIVTVLHTIFDFLAFKNEIQFWKNSRSLEGLSLRTLFLNAFSELIIFLYLLDNETSWIVIVSAFVGVVIEFWKITKGFDISVDFGKAIPIIIKEKDAAGRSSEVREYDEQAMRYFSYALYPLAISYAIYELMGGSHKSWYSYILDSATGFVLTFGFIRMCPQLFINYKMKSVAHIPWRAFTYKSLNTFIDDLFAFVVKMPTLHRIGCFRDDIVFFIFLYQKWIYPVDKSRVNEFGQSFEEKKEKEKVEEGNEKEKQE